MGEIYHIITGAGAIPVDKKQAVELAEQLLRWAYKGADPNHFPDDTFPSRLASHLWNMSTLRHGMFTPAQFADLIVLGVLGFLNTPPDHGQEIQTPPA